MLPYNLHPDAFHFGKVMAELYKSAYANWKSMPVPEGYLAVKMSYGAYSLIELEKQVDFEVVSMKTVASGGERGMEVQFKIPDGTKVYAGYTFKKNGVVIGNNMAHYTGTEHWTKFFFFGDPDTVILRARAKLPDGAITPWQEYTLFMDD